jgi:D-amino-acid oxidase
MRVIVVGTGVIGLTCAVRLAEAGHDTHVLARDRPLETTSAVAGAIWYPYRAAPVERVTAWSRTTYDVLRALAADPDTGVTLRWGTELHRRPMPDPWWAGAVSELLPLDQAPDGYVGGWRFPAPVIDPVRHLLWLERRLVEAGGTVTRMALSALPDHGVVVNATGLAARRLAADPSVDPVRGQVVLCTGAPVEEWTLDQSDETALTYVIPRGDPAGTVVVGGTAEEGRWDLQPEPDVAGAILERAQTLVPELAGARVVGHRVGLRPARPAVRLEAQTRPDGGTTVHCYGNGGAGWTLAWGCADEVLALAEAAARRVAGETS